MGAVTLIPPHRLINEPCRRTHSLNFSPPPAPGSSHQPPRLSCCNVSLTTSLAYLARTFSDRAPSTVAHPAGDRPQFQSPGLTPPPSPGCCSSSETCGPRPKGPVPHAPQPRLTLSQSWAICLLGFQPVDGSSLPCSSRLRLAEGQGCVCVPEGQAWGREGLAELDHFHLPL